MNYIESREYLEKVSKYGSILGLDSIKELLKRLRNPEKRLRVVHIAGTNGKGSVFAMLQSMLISAGYSVGKYSSPEVFSYREIIQYNGKDIEKHMVAEIITEIKYVCDTMVTEGRSHPTKFEIETAMAFMYFKLKKCDIVLVETGMGGALDATNVMEKVLCSVISTISLDHMQFLGNTIKKIAEVKAGIIKERCPVVVSKQSDEAIKTIRSYAKKRNSRMIVANEADNIHNHKNIATGVYTANNKRHYSINLHMMGTFQIINAATAIETALILEKKGYERIAENIEKGIVNARWRGRMEVICKRPLVVIDGAHNSDAAIKLRESMEMYFTNKRITFIMGMLADKDYEQVVKIMAPLAVNIITVKPDNNRALNAQKLAETAIKYSERTYASKSMGDAVTEAFNSIEDGISDMILAFGSLSYLGELKKIVNQTVKAERIYNTLNNNITHTNNN